MIITNNRRAVDQANDFHGVDPTPKSLENLGNKESLQPIAGISSVVGLIMLCEMNGLGPKIFSALLLCGGISLYCWICFSNFWSCPRLQDCKRFRFTDKVSNSYDIRVDRENDSIHVDLKALSLPQCYKHNLHDLLAVNISFEIKSDFRAKGKTGGHLAGVLLGGAIGGVTGAMMGGVVGSTSDISKTQFSPIIRGISVGLLFRDKKSISDAMNIEFPVFSGEVDPSDKGAKQKYYELIDRLRYAVILKSWLDTVIIEQNALESNTGETVCSISEHEANVVIPDVSTYEGGWYNQTPNGIGRIVWRNRGYYVGSWCDGQFEGRGLLVDSNNGKLQWTSGSFSKGKANGRIDVVEDLKLIIIGSFTDGHPTASCVKIDLNTTLFSAN
jgi:hypothetical protein